MEELRCASDAVMNASSLITLFGGFGLEVVELVERGTDEEKGNDSRFESKA